MKKLLLSLSICTLITLCLSIQSHAAVFTLEYKLGEWCIQSGDVCTIKIEILKAPDNAATNRNYSTAARCLNKDFTKEGVMRNTIGLSFSPVVSGTPYYVNIEPVDAKLITDNTYLFTISYSTKPKYSLVQ